MLMPWVRGCCLYWEQADPVLSSLRQNICSINTYCVINMSSSTSIVLSYFSLSTSNKHQNVKFQVCLNAALNFNVLCTFFATSYFCSTTFHRHIILYTPYLTAVNLGYIADEDFTVKTYYHPIIHYYRLNYPRKNGCSNKQLLTYTAYKTDSETINEMM